jgi:cytochrome P450
VLILDLFMAGSETTSNTLEFAILYMMLYPEVQRKVQQEIDTVIGSDRFPTAADRAK